MIVPDRSAESLRRDALGRLIERVAARTEAADMASAERLAAEFGVGIDEVEACLAAMAVIRDAVGSTEEEIEFFFQDWSPNDERELQVRAPDDYEIREELGRGGMGIVFRARQLSLNREVALKIIRPCELLFGRSIARFKKEAQNLARLRHPHIVSIHDVGESDGQLWFTMNLIEGENLAQIIARGEITATRAVRILRQVASAVAYTHGHGLIHRDLKPHNILIDRDGEAYVTDFGLSREVSDDPGLTQTGQVIGTPAYMSPEQARGDSARVGETTDIYALGAVLYECLAGRPPFKAPSPAETLHAVIHSDPVRPRKLNPRCPADLEIIALKALEKEPQRRYATVRALQEDLERFEEGRPIRGRRPSTSYRLWRFVRRNSAPLVAASVSAAVLLLLFAFIILPRLGQDVATTLAHAREFAQRGDLDAAAMLYEKGLAANPEGAEARDASDRFAECLLDLVPRMRADGDSQQACRLLEACLAAGRAARGIDPENRPRSMKSDTYWPAEGPVAVQLALCEGVTTSTEAGIRRLDEAESLLREKASRFADTNIEELLSVEGKALELMLEALRSELIVDRPLAEELARLWLSRRLDSDPANSATLRKWYEREEDSEFSLLPAMLAVTAHRPSFLPGSPIRRVLGDPAARARIREVVGEVGPFTGPALVTTLLEVDDISDILHWAQRSSGGWSETLRQWSNLEQETRVSAHRSLVEKVIDALDVDLIHRAQPWLLRWTGRAAEGHTEAELISWWKSWWAIERQGDPRDWLAKACKLEVVPDVDDRLRLVELLEERPTARRARWLHRLLLLLTPVSERIVIWSTHDPRAPKILARAWRDLLSGAASAFREDARISVRTAVFLYVDGSWSDQPVWREQRTGSVGRSERFSFQRPVAMESAAWRVTLQPPGLGPLTGPTSSVARHGLEYTVDTRVVRDEVIVSFPGFSRITVIGGIHTSWGTSGSGRWPMFRVAPVSSRIGQRSGPVLYPLVLVSDPSDAVDSWDLEQWRSRIAEDFDEVCRELNEKEALGHDLPEWIQDHQDYLSGLTEMAQVLPIPEAIGALRRLEQELEDHARWRRLVDRVFLARVMAGDLQLIQDPDFAARFDAIKNQHAYEFTAAGGRSGFLVLLAALTPHPDLRDFAIERLQRADLSDDQVRELERLVGLGRLPRLEWLEVRASSLERPSEWGQLLRGAPLLSILVLVAVLMLIVSVIALMLPGRPRASRLRPAAVLVGIGLFLVVLRLERGRLDCLPDSIGLALMLLGVLVLGASAEGRWRWVPATCFSIALLGDVILRLSGHSFWIGLGAGIAAGLGVASLPVLASLLLAGPLEEGDRPFNGLRPRVASCVSAALILLTIAFPAFDPVPLAGFLAFCWFLQALFHSPARRGEGEKRHTVLPRRFLILYVIPVILCLFVAVTGRIRGDSPAVTKVADGGILAVGGMLVAVAWSLLRLLFAASSRSRSDPLTPTRA